MLALEIAIISEQGGRSYNEDACGHWHSDHQLCCVMADGAGGHGGGDIASRLAVERTLQAFAEHPTADGPALLALLQDTNRVVRGSRVPGTVREQMYSTVVCLVVDFQAHQAHWAHAGDSRLYWFRGGRIAGQTKDHSLVQALVDAGMLEADQMRSHPNRSELRSALGTEDHELEVSSTRGAEAVDAGDVFLMCTDGVWEYITEDVLEQTLQAAATPSDWLAELERRVREATRHKSSHDNFTALTVWLDEADESAGPT
jgi:PPM family protein phosphatase